MNDENIKNNTFLVSCDDGSLILRSGRFIKNALGDIINLTVKTFAFVSDMNLCSYLKTSLPSSFERLFCKHISILIF